MKTKDPDCINNCSTCYYMQLNKCIAQEGDNFYIPNDQTLLNEDDIMRFELTEFDGIVEVTRDI